MTSKEETEEVDDNRLHNMIMITSNLYLCESSPNLFLECFEVCAAVHHQIPQLCVAEPFAWANFC
jgi:hypothetical protein